MGSGNGSSVPKLEETTQVKGRTCETITSPPHVNKISCAGEFSVCKVVLHHIKYLFKFLLRYWNCHSVLNWTDYYFAFIVSDNN